MLKKIIGPINKVVIPQVVGSLATGVVNPPSTAARNQQFSGMPTAQSFSTTTSKCKFSHDVMFGTAGGNTRKLALEKEMSTDNWLFSSGDRSCKKEDLEKYREAFVQFAGHEPPEDFQDERPWVLFNFANRKLLDEEPNDPPKQALGNIAYGVQAAKTALERGGQVVFNLNGWTPKLYMQQSLAAEVEHGMPFPQYLHSSLVPAPTITNLELGGFLERDDLKNLPIQYLSYSGHPLDRAKLAEVFDAAVQACRSDENRARLADALRDSKPRDDSFEEFMRTEDVRRQIGRFEFNSAGRQALDALEKYIA